MVFSRLAAKLQIGLPKIWEETILWTMLHDKFFWRSCFSLAVLSGKVLFVPGNTMAPSIVLQKVTISQEMLFENGNIAKALRKTSEA